MRHSKRIILSLIVVLILGIYWHYLRQAGVDLNVKQKKPVPVRVAKVTRVTLPNRVHTLGTVRTQRPLNIDSSGGAKGAYTVVVYLLPEKYADVAKLGQTIIVKKIHDTKETTLGVVASIDKSDLTTVSGSKFHDLRVVARLSKSKVSLMPGLMVSVTQVLGKEVRTLAVPKQSIVPTGQGSQVFTVVDGKAKAVSIKTGITANNKVQVIAGLSLDDIVITDHLKEINNGVSVIMLTPEWQSEYYKQVQ